jgi:hypothetical protein
MELKIVGHAVDEDQETFRRIGVQHENRFPHKQAEQHPNKGDVQLGDQCEKPLVLLCAWNACNRSTPTTLGGNPYSTSAPNLIAALRVGHIKDGDQIQCGTVQILWTGSSRGRSESFGALAHPSQAVQPRVGFADFGHRFHGRKELRYG